MPGPALLVCAKLWGTWPSKDPSPSRWAHRRKNAAVIPPPTLLMWRGGGERGPTFWSLVWCLLSYSTQDPPVEEGAERKAENAEKEQKQHSADQRGGPGVTQREHWGAPLLPSFSLTTESIPLSHRDTWSNRSTRICPPTGGGCVGRRSSLCSRSKEVESMEFEV